MTLIIFLTSWTDMTFSSMDFVYITWFIVNTAWAYFTIKANKKEIEELKKNTDIKARIAILEEKYDDVNKNFGNLEVQIAKLRFEIVKDVIYEVRKIFGNKK